jgi:hypothetical protein
VEAAHRQGHEEERPAAGYFAATHVDEDWRKFV